MPWLYRGFLALPQEWNRTIAAIEMIVPAPLIIA